MMARGKMASAYDNSSFKYLTGSS